MKRNYKLAGSVACLILALALWGCDVGPSASGSFDKSLDVDTPLHLELASVSGDLSITGSTDAKVHVHGEVHASGMGLGNPQDRVNQIVANPPIELRGNTLRIGRQPGRLRHVSISYTVEVPRDTDVVASSVSGSITIRGVKGPVQAESVSGSVNARDIAHGSRLSSTSGSIQAENCAEDVRATSVSGSVDVVNAKGDVLAHSVSGNVTVRSPGGRVDSDTASGSVEIRGANDDVKAHTASGRVDIAGNPSGNSYWDLKTMSGSINISVPPDANFHLSSSAVSGQIRTQVPIVIEEQGKHSLRARMGSGNGRVEVRTVSGSVELDGSQPQSQ